MRSGDVRVRCCDMGFLLILFRCGDSGNESPLLDFRVSCMGAMELLGSGNSWNEFTSRRAYFSRMRGCWNTRDQLRCF